MTKDRSTARCSGIPETPRFEAQNAWSTLVASPLPQGSKKGPAGDLYIGVKVECLGLQTQSRSGSGCRVGVHEMFRASGTPAISSAKTLTSSLRAQWMFSTPSWELPSLYWPQRPGTFGYVSTGGLQLAGWPGAYRDIAIQDLGPTNHSMSWI